MNTKSLFFQAFFPPSITSNVNENAIRHRFHHSPIMQNYSVKAAINIYFKTPSNADNVQSYGRIPDYLLPCIWKKKNISRHEYYNRKKLKDPNFWAEVKGDQNQMHHGSIRSAHFNRMPNQNATLPCPL